MQLPQDFLRNTPKGIFISFFGSCATKVAQIFKTAKQIAYYLSTMCIFEEFMSCIVFVISNSLICFFKLSIFTIFTILTDKVKQS